MNHACLEYDVRVLVHEAGHAVHSFLSHDLSHDWMKDTPSEVAELASMSMELFTMEHWEHFYPDPEDLKRAKRNHLEGLLTTLPAWLGLIVSNIGYTIRGILCKNGIKHGLISLVVLQATCLIHRV